MPINPNFVGPSYSLDSLPSGVQRTINLVPVPQEPGNERTGWVFKDAPGLTEFITPEGHFGGDPYFDSVLFLMSGRGAGIVDSSSYARTLTTAGTTPVFNGTAKFGRPTFSTPDATSRVMCVADNFMNSMLTNSAFTIDGWFNIAADGGSGNFFAMGPFYGLLPSVDTIGFNCSGVGGSSISVGGACTWNNWHYVRYIRDKTDPTFDYFKLAVDGTTVATSSSFLKSANVPTSPADVPGFGYAAGYGTIGPTMRFVDFRVTLVQRSLSEVPTDSVPIIQG